MNDFILLLNTTWIFNVIPLSGFISLLLFILDTFSAHSRRLLNITFFMNRLILHLVIKMTAN